MIVHGGNNHAALQTHYGRYDLYYKPSIRGPQIIMQEHSVGMKFMDQASHETHGPSQTMLCQIINLQTLSGTTP